MSNHETFNVAPCIFFSHTCRNRVVEIIRLNAFLFQILLDSARFSVITIPYDFEGTTLDDLLMKLKMKLSGRLAR